MCAEIRDELELVRLQHQQAEFEAKMAKRSAAAAEAACAAALANAAAAEQQRAQEAEPTQEDGELAELLQELDSVQVEMTGATALARCSSSARPDISRGIKCPSG